jgi:hypothetical protein
MSKHPHQIIFNHDHFTCTKCQTTHWIIGKHDQLTCTKMSNKPIESFSSMITLTCTKMSSNQSLHFPRFWHVLFHQEGTTLDSPTSMTQKFVELIRSAACTASQVPMLMRQGGMQVCILVQRQVRAACPATAGTSQWPPTHSAIN